MQIVVKSQNIGKRLDAYLAESQSQKSRSYWQKAIDSGFVKVSKQNVKSGYKLKENDQLSIDFPLEKLKPIVLPVIFEDEDVIVLNKSAGVLTHSKGEFNPEPTVATFIEPKLDGLGGERAGIVHRLDRATSGVIICAKNEPALKFLQKQFSLRLVIKTYLAVVEGAPKEKQAIIDAPIERNPKKPQTFRVNVNGKPAQTSYRVLKTGQNYSLLELIPKTGRTHQLRVHLSFIKAPILGDVLYGGNPYKRLMLHAKSLKVKLPRGGERLFEAPVPKEFKIKL